MNLLLLRDAYKIVRRDFPSVLKRSILQVFCVSAINIAILYSLAFNPVAVCVTLFVTLLLGLFSVYVAGEYQALVHKEKEPFDASSHTKPASPPINRSPRPRPRLSGSNPRK